MKPNRFYSLLTVAMLFIFNTPVVYAGSIDIIGEFTGALYNQNSAKMQLVVKQHKAEIPGKIEELLAVAVKPGLSKQVREEQFYLLERLATVYKDVTGDFSYLKKIKKSSFETKLSPAIVSKPQNGKHIVETISTETVKNMFKPNNIIIKVGDTVKWVNHDKTTHLLGSVMTSIGKGGIFSPHVQPGESWEHTFNTPGEYYYICFIHKIMYGKVLVEE